MPRRTKYEIWVEILEVCLNQSRHQSWILRELGLKTDHVKDSIQFLIDRDLLHADNQEEEKWVGYQTTLKGKEALLHFYTLITNFFPQKKK